MEVYPIIDVLKEGTCIARWCKDYRLQCPRQAKELGLCGYCSKRKIKYLASETYTVKKKKQPPKPNTRKIRVKRKTKFLSADYLQHSAVEDVSAKSLKLTLLKLGIAYKTTDRKPVLFSRLEDYYKPIYPYIKYKNDINKIIHLYRRYARNSEKRMRGPGFTNPSLCVNDTDFYTCEQLSELEPKYLFTYENNGIIYGFDIRSFKKLLDYTSENPYDKTPIPDNVIQYHAKLYKLHEETLDIIPADVLTKEQMLNHEIMSAFQVLDDLNYYTDVDWFSKLSRIELIIFYVEAEDIWSYRAGLSNSARNDIVPGGRAFTLVRNRKYKVLKNKSKSFLRKECIKEMKRITTNGRTRDDNVLGALYIMSALVMVSRGAYNAYSHLWNPSSLCPSPPIETI